MSDEARLEQTEALEGDLAVTREESEDVLGGRVARDVDLGRKKAKKKKQQQQQTTTTPNLSAATRQKLTGS